MSATIIESSRKLKDLMLNSDHDHPSGDPYPLIPGPRKEDMVAYMYYKINK